MYHLLNFKYNSHIIKGNFNFIFSAISTFFVSPSSDLTENNYILKKVL